MAKKDNGRDEKGRFKIGHLWSLGNKGGQPPKYKTHTEVHNQIGEYLQWEETASKGKYTLSGVALFMGFATRKSFDDQGERDSKFLYVINRYRLFLKHYHEQRLTWVGSFQGSKLWLTNYGGYIEESTQNIHQTVTEVKPQVQKGTPPLANKE